MAAAQDPMSDSDYEDIDEIEDYERAYNPNYNKNSRKISSEEGQNVEIILSDDDEVVPVTETKNDKDKKEQNTGRRNIRRDIKDEDISETSKQADSIERERRKRMQEKEKMYNQTFQSEQTISSKLKELPLDFDPKTGEVIVQVDPYLVKELKPHQAKGIKFMWDSVFESGKDIQNKKYPGGAILAHCMGLGKTLQTITLIHTVMKNFSNEIKTTLVLVPVNTIKNWSDEFKKWIDGPLAGDRMGPKATVQTYDMLGCPSDLGSKEYQLKMWADRGGVMVMGYDMFRTLANKVQGGPNPQGFICKETLIDPGPNFVVCDEGHVLKNMSSALNKAVSRIKTLRRVVLSGTPLQNNLDEYYAMINFVKPNLLGTVQEFKNRFVNPIKNGQHKDSTERDVKLMKKRTFVLGDLLKGCMQRLDYTVLVPYLKPKFEYVLCISLSKFQKKLYSYYLQNVARGGKLGNDGKLSGGKQAGLFNDVQALKKVWNHPYLLRAENSGQNWWSEFLNPEEAESAQMSKIELGNKMILLIDILKECQGMDKVLVFSQSIPTLNLIEAFLRKESRKWENASPYEKDQFCGPWNNERDYFRMDGQTNVDKRRHYCNIFNDEQNKQSRLFLISTKAGGIGINLVGANRVIIFDASWNPSHDVQAIFRVYRFGQKKPVYIYRFVAKGTMEEIMYDRQVEKEAMAKRVIDDEQIERHFNAEETASLYVFNDEPDSAWKGNKEPKDKLLSELCKRHGPLIWKFHEHNSLLVNQDSENLSKEDQEIAMKEFENEQKGIFTGFAGGAGRQMFPQMYQSSYKIPQLDTNSIKAQYRKQYPHLTEEQVNKISADYVQKQRQDAYKGRPTFGPQGTGGSYHGPNTNKSASTGSNFSGTINSHAPSSNNTSSFNAHGPSNKTNSMNAHAPIPTNTNGFNAHGSAPNYTSNNNIHGQQGYQSSYTPVNNVHGRQMQQQPYHGMGNNIHGQQTNHYNPPNNFHQKQNYQSHPVNNMHSQQNYRPNTANNVHSQQGYPYHNNNNSNNNYGQSGSGHKPQNYNSPANSIQPNYQRPQNNMSWPHSNVNGQSYSNTSHMTSNNNNNSWYSKPNGTTNSWNYPNKELGSRQEPHPSSQQSHSQNYGNNMRGHFMGNEQRNSFNNFSSAPNDGFQRQGMANGFGMNGFSGSNVRQNYPMNPQQPMTRYNNNNIPEQRGVKRMPEMIDILDSDEEEANNRGK